MQRERVIRLTIIVVSLYLIVTTGAGTLDLLKSGDKVTRRESDLALLKKQNQDLVKKNKEADTPEYLQRIAYDKLGLSLPGEQVIVIPQELLANGNKAVAASGEPNWKKWVGLVF